METVLNLLKTAYEYIINQHEFMVKCHVVTPAVEEKYKKVLELLSPTVNIKIDPAKESNFNIKQETSEEIISGKLSEFSLDDEHDVKEIKRFPNKKEEAANLITKNKESFNMVKTRQNTKVKHHHRTNPDVKPYRCDLCHSKFRRKSHLKYHLKIHTGKKAYKCKFCLRYFKQSSYLKIHLRNHTN